MSYNISNWKVKNLDGLAIPVAALCEGNDYFDAPRLDIKTGSFSIDGMDGTYINGTIENGHIYVTEIECHGEGSGSTYHKVLRPALEKSAGALIVSCVWEGGEDITRLIVKDGIVTEEDIDL